MSECKPILAKPCVGKMNGPLPSSVALPPSVGESEKPEAEKAATVEVEYIESENLDNVDDADAVLKVFFSCLLLMCYGFIKSHFSLV